MRVGDPWPRVLGAIVLCTCLLPPALGYAQTTAPAPAPDPAAQLLFDQAIAEMEARRAGWSAGVAVAPGGLVVKGAW